MNSDYNNLDDFDTLAADYTFQTLCLTIVTFLLRLIDWFVQMDAVLEFFMHLVITISGLFAIATGYFALRDRFKKK